LRHSLESRQLSPLDEFGVKSAVLGTPESPLASLFVALGLAGTRK
jgi:hypothetical protein